MMDMRVIDLSHNKLRVLSSHTFYNVSSIDRVLLAHNKLENVEAGAFYEVRRVGSFEAQNNRLKIFSCKAFSSFVRVEQIDFSFNQLTRWHLNQQLPSLFLSCLYWSDDGLKQLDAMTAILFSALTCRVWNQVFPESTSPTISSRALKRTYSRVHLCWTLFLSPKTLCWACHLGHSKHCVLFETSISLTITWESSAGALLHIRLLEVLSWSPRDFVAISSYLPRDSLVTRNTLDQFTCEKANCPM